MESKELKNILKNSTGYRPIISIIAKDLGLGCIL
jgi:hypothetical protein